MVERKDIPVFQEKFLQNKKSGRKDIMDDVECRVSSAEHRDAIEKGRKYGMLPKYYYL